MRENFLDDPRFDDAGVEFALVMLCRVLAIDPVSIDWDAATETFEGDVQSVISKILCAKFGDEWPTSGKPIADQIELAAARAAVGNVIIR